MDKTIWIQYIASGDHSISTVISFEDTPYFEKPEDEEILALSAVVETSYFKEFSDEAGSVGRQD